MSTLSFVCIWYTRGWSLAHDAKEVDLDIFVDVVIFVFVRKCSFVV